MKEKQDLLLQILRVRQQLQAITQISYSYSVMNKKFRRIEDMEYPELIQLDINYRGLCTEILEIASKIKYEYEQQRMDKTT